MSYLTPPPDQPMDATTRARIAARLHEATGTPAAGERETQWLAPVGAAAAVLLIAAVAGWAAFGSGDKATPVAPSSPTSASSEPSQAPSSEAPVPNSECVGYAERKVEGGEVVMAVALRDGSAFVFANDDRYVLCEDSGGIVTAHPDRPVAPPAVLDPGLLGFSSSIYLANPQRMKGAYVAGGRLPDDVAGLRYTFPGDAVVEAAIHSDDQGRRWWIVEHVPEDGPLTDPQQSRLELPPVEVEVERVGAPEQVTLQWGRDDCAHVNHGC